MSTIPLTQKEFIKRCRSVHGRIYSYSNTIYTTTKNKVVITCRKHGDFEQKANKHLQGQGCGLCASEAHSNLMSNRTKMSEEDFLIELKMPKGQTYLGSFINLTTPVDLCCATHGAYRKSPQALLKGNFCQSCARNRITTADFIRLATEKHGNKYDYSKVDYRSVAGKVTIICNKHGVFKQSQSSHINCGKGCPKCVKKRYSKIAIKWLELEHRKRRIKIQHAENGGEYYIAEAKIYVDGYNPRSRTVFEFYGDAYHGNLNRYKANSFPNPFSSLTARKLYEKTQKREKLLLSLGYKVVSIWESEFKQLLRSMTWASPK